MKTGNKIKKWRESVGLTQVQLADKLGISSRMVSMWETGRHYPGPRSRRDLKALGCEV